MSLWKTAWPFVWINLFSHDPRRLWVKYGIEIDPAVLEKQILNVDNFFRYFAFIILGKGHGISFYQTRIPFKLTRPESWGKQKILYIWTKLLNNVFLVFFKTARDLNETCIKPEQCEQRNPNSTCSVDTCIKGKTYIFTNKHFFYTAKRIVTSLLNKIVSLMIFKEKNLKRGDINFSFTAASLK